MDLIDSLVESKQFITNVFIRKLIDKSIKLAISIEAIKQTFRQILILYFEQNKNIDLFNIDYSNIIDENDYIEKLVINSVEMCQESDCDIDQKTESPTQTFQDYYTESINRLNSASNLRPIIIDAIDIALFNQQNKQILSLVRVKKVVEYFEKRNHKNYVILPLWRKEQVIDKDILNEMESNKIIHYIPSKQIKSKKVFFDDRSFVLNLAVIKKGIIVSNNSFERYVNHSEDFRQVIEKRVLMYSFIDENFLPIENPLGKNGPDLTNFLRFETIQNQYFLKPCPYMAKCTYGSKCKYWHENKNLNQNMKKSKSAYEAMLDESNRQKIRLEIILNEPNESVLYSEINNIKRKNFNFIQENLNDENNFIKSMGPVEKIFNKFSLTIKPDLTNDFLEQLKEILGGCSKVDEFLAKYKNESNQDKLLTLANGYAFEF